LGTIDIYATNCASSGLSLMSCTGSDILDDQRTFHLDPWHKMRLGWVRPRIFPFGSGGVATVTAAQFQSDNTPVILYDPSHGTSEYFIVEFRNNNPAVGGGGYDLDLRLSGNPSEHGLALWHVVPGHDPPVFHAGGRDLTQGNSLWNQWTPPLRWNDGTIVSTRLNLLQITPDGHEMVFEWLFDTWVTFDYAGVEFGTFSNPFNTLIEGVNASRWGGFINLTPGSTTEALTINKGVILDAVGGTVNIGRR
jgi:hypothetical protein